MKRPRSVGLCIVLSIITYGIYLYYWIYCIHRDVHEVSGQPEATSGGLVVLLCIVTCGIYYFYWNYRMGQLLDEAKGYPGASDGILYLVLSIFGLGIVSLALMQSELNRFTAHDGGL